MNRALAERVARGAALLDQVRPNWAAEVAVDRLAMTSCDRCILGQLYGHYASGCRELIATLPSTFLFVASEHGFTLPEDVQYRTFREHGPEAVVELFAPLADTWRAAIAGRLEPAEARP